MPDPDFIPSAHYRAANIFAVQEWAIARLKADGPDNIDEEVADIADWCDVWLRNDPRDNGGDMTVRRGMRREWPSIFYAYRRLAGR